MAFPDSFLDDVRRTADIVRVISDHVSLRKVGNSWKGLCPFHQEKSPSFNVRSDPAVFHCFGCGEGGDVFRFVMLYERVGFPEAVRTIAARFSMPLPAESAAPDLAKGEREELLGVLEAAAQHFTQVLWSAAGTSAREYLLGRGFEKRTLEQIRAGAARDAWGDLVDGLRRRFALPLLVKAGLAIERNDGKGAYDRFRNRAVFPITNESGKVVGFGARSLDGSEPKYLNSPETPVYQKSRTLYGLSWAKDALRRENSLILMEGYLDVARALEKGVGSAVATCGTALTASHARLLRRFTERVYVNFDQDSAGQRAAQKSIDVLLDEGLRVHVVQLPAGHDPDTFLKEFGGDAYRGRLAEAPSYMQWLIDRAAQENDTTTPEGKGRYLNTLLPTLARIENAVERAAWLPAVVDRGRLEGKAAQEELRRAVAARASTAPASATQPAAPRVAAALLSAERLLLVQLLSGNEGAAGALMGLSDEDIEPLRSAEVLRAAQKLQGQGTAPTLAALEATLGEGEQRLLRELALSAAPAGGQSPVECVRALRDVGLSRRLADIQQRLEKAAGDAKLTALLSDEKMKLTRLQRQLERPGQES
jgi:DNA primase